MRVAQRPLCVRHASLWNGPEWLTSFRRPSSIGISASWRWILRKLQKHQQIAGRVFKLMRLCLWAHELIQALYLISSLFFAPTEAVQHSHCPPLLVAAGNVNTGGARRLPEEASKHICDESGAEILIIKHRVYIRSATLLNQRLYQCPWRTTLGG